MFWHTNVPALFLLPSLCYDWGGGLQGVIGLVALVRVGVLIWYSMGLSYWGLFPVRSSRYGCEGQTLVHMDLTSP